MENQNSSQSSNVQPKNRFDRFFKISERGSSITKELLGGLTIFLAMMYILPVNMSILSSTGMPAGAVFAATAISAAVASIIMGLYANYPIALASGMGINAMFAFTAVGKMGFSWEEALAMVFISGVLFLIISLTNVRKIIINAIPKNLKLAVGVGIGFFIAFIGFKNAGIIVDDSATFVTLGNFANPTVLLGLAGIILVLILSVLKGKINRFAIIISMAIIALVGFILGLCGVGDMPAFDFSSTTKVSDIGLTFGKCFAAIPSLLKKPEAYALMFTFLFVDFFDTAGTLVAVGQEANLVNEEGELVGADRAFLADAVGTVAGAVLGTSTVTSFIESTTGIKSGARTGLAAVATGALFLLALVAFPIFSIFNSVGDFSPTTALALVMVGALMFKQISGIDFNDLPATVAAFITIITMVLTYSISNGIAFGFTFYVILMLVSKRYKEINPIMYVLSALFIINFVVGAIMQY